MRKPPAPRGRHVPTGRFGRAARLGGLTAGLLGGAAWQGASHAARGKPLQARDLMLTPGNARRIARQLAGMRGAAMKLGQLLSMETGDMLPPEIAEPLARLRADADFMPPKQLKTVLARNYGPDFLKRFQKFDVSPIAAASIGQVHRATAPDGRDMALKIQYPGIRQSIDADLANLGLLLRHSGLLPAGIDLDQLLDEAGRQLHDEADYAREARCMTRFGSLLAEDPGMAVPQHHPDFSTDDILAMSFMPSQPFEVLETADQATRATAVTRLFDLFLRELFDWQLVQTDPNLANYRWDPSEQRIVLLDFGAARDVPDAHVSGLRALLAAALEADLDGIGTALEDLGFIGPATPPPLRKAILDLAAKALPIITQDSFDFADSAFAANLRDEAMALGRTVEQTEVPPVSLLLLQRKAAGLFLTAIRMRARVRVRDLVQSRIAR